MLFSKMRIEQHTLHFQSICNKLTTPWFDIDVAQHCHRLDNSNFFFQEKPRKTHANRLTALRDLVANNEQVQPDLSEQIIALQNTVTEQSTLLTNQYNAYQAELIEMEESLHQIDRENHCPICFEGWMDEGPHRMVSLRCGHLYGDVCIRLWLDEKSHCPFCWDPVNIMDLRYIHGRCILPRLQRDQLQSLQLRGAPSVQHAFCNFQQLARRFSGVLELAQERPQPGQPETVLQQNLWAMRQLLSVVDWMTGKLFLEMQLPPPDERETPSVPLPVLEEEAQLLALEAENVSEEAQRIISSVSSGQRQDPAVPYQDNAVIRSPRRASDPNQAPPAPAAQIPPNGNGSRRRPRVPSPEDQAPDEQENGGRRRRRISGPPTEDNQAPDEQENGPRRRRIRGPPPEDNPAPDEQGNGRRRRRVRGPPR